MTSALVRYENPDAVRKDLVAMAPTLRDIIPSAVEQGRFVRVVAKAIIENPKLMECTRASLVAAVHEAAQLGLEPTGLLGSAYLVPYRRRVQVDGQWVTVHEAKLIPGYRGLIDLARRSGEIDGITATVVRRKDHFRLLEGTNPGIEHERFIPDPTGTPEERDPGPIVGVYMVATLRGGHRQVEWMSADEVEGIRKRSKAADDGPWVTDPAEMARKTVVRRGSKYLPLTTEFRRALELDEEAERNAEEPPRIAPPNAATAMLLDRAAAQAGTVRTVDATSEASDEEEQGSPDTGEGQNESPGSSDEGSQEAPDPEVVDGEVQEVPPATTEGTPPDATPVVREAVQEERCGDDGGMLGLCALSPRHRGMHQNAKGVKWPR